ncbi:MAG: hypothetical protein ACLFR2_03440 [Candidatus Kapaibacterium sp.]
MWIEIFRAGKHRDSAGREAEFNESDLDTISANYNSERSPTAPLVKGHPQSDSPALGWVERLARRGSVLMAKLKDIDEGFAQEVRDGRYRRISVSLKPGLKLKHVGFLGGASPAVEDLKPVEFSLDFRNISEFEEDKETGILKNKIALLEKEQRIKEFRSFCDSMINFPGGPKLTPGQAPLIIDILENAHRSSTELPEGAKSPVEKIKEFVASLPSLEFTKELPIKGTFTNDSGISGERAEPGRMKVHRKALELIGGNPSMSYEEAALEAERIFINLKGE